MNGARHRAAAATWITLPVLSPLVTSRLPKLALAPACALLLTAGLAACGRQAPAPAAPAVPPTELAALDTPPPDYPLELACRNVAGTATLGVTVGVAGMPTEVKVLRGSGNAQLDRSALERVKTWKFKPATRGGQPHAQTIQVPVTFTPPAVRPTECFQFDRPR